MVGHLEIMVMIQRVTFILLCALPESQFDRHKPFEGCLTFMKVFLKAKLHHRLRLKVLSRVLRFNSLLIVDILY